MKTCSLVAALLACALTTAPSPAQDAATVDATIDGLRLGEYWSGAKISKKDLFGKVVLVEIWGS